MMISDKELYERIDQVCEDYHGDIDHLCRVVGMIVLGRLFGWRVMRLVSSAHTWRLATKLFGDPKQLIPERGPLAHKSVGLKLVDRIGDYWGFVRGSISRDQITVEQRKMIA